MDLAHGLGLESVLEGARHETNPSSVRESAAFCSRVKLLNALRAVVRIGLSTVGSSINNEILTRARREEIHNKHPVSVPRLLPWFRPCPL